jgi:hypothetical protein
MRIYILRLHESVMWGYVISYVLKVSIIREIVLDQ